MSKPSYTYEFKLKVASEAAQPENRYSEHLVARKYNLRPSTVARWKKTYEEHGAIGLSKRFHPPSESLETIAYKKRIQELEEEVEILKKAAAFIVKVTRE